MASVVFVIRVPCEIRDGESRSRKKSERNEESKDEKEEIGKQVDGSETNNENTEDQELQEKKINSPEDLQDDDVEFVSPKSIVEVLRNVLQSLDIQGTSWQVTEDKQFHQVMFLEKGGERVDSILKNLTECGIGIRPKSSISVIPTSVHIGQDRKDLCSTSDSKRESGEDVDKETQPLLEEKMFSKDAFIKSVKAKMTVQQVVEGVRTQAQLTFDFVMFTVLASLIAAVGLVENNSVVLVASMLVSPLMGPILGGTFGGVIKNTKLRNMGIKSEICGITIAVLVGFFFGFICGPFGLDGVSWDANQDSWPTKEMTSRGMLRGWWVGLLIALPSGAGVALSVLGGNTGSLVGVAISASLLPPAVNSGMLWAFSIICAIKHPELERTEINGTQVMNQGLDCPALRDNSYKPMYSCHMGEEAAIMAVVSLVLTIINISCIIITGTLVLKLKEVAPMASSSDATQTFWTQDVKIARQAYQTFKGTEATNFKNTFLKEWTEWKQINNPNEQPESPIAKEVELLGIIQGVEDDPSFQQVVTRAPRGNHNVHQISRQLKQQISQDLDVDITEDDEAMAFFRSMMTIRTLHPAHHKSEANQRHIETIFEQPTDQEPKKGREFVVTDIEKPHHTSIVRVRPPTNESESYSVLTESGV